MPVKIGDQAVSKAYVGDTPLSRVYVGDTLVADFGASTGGGSGGGTGTGDNAGLPVLFTDDFATFDTSKWVTYPDNTAMDPLMARSPHRAANVRVSGGELVMSLKRETAAVTGSNNTGDTRLSGSWTGTFAYPDGVAGAFGASAGILAEWTVPFRVQFTIKRPAAPAADPGIWPAFWLIQLHRPTINGKWELDFLENSPNVNHPRTQVQYGHHLWQPSGTTAAVVNNGTFLTVPWDAGTTYFDARVDVLMSGPRYYVKATTETTWREISTAPRPLVGGPLNGQARTTADLSTLMTPTPVFGALWDVAAENGYNPPETGAESLPVGGTYDMRVPKFDVYDLTGVLS